MGALIAAKSLEDYPHIVVSLGNTRMRDMLAATFRETRPDPDRYVLSPSFRLSTQRLNVYLTEDHPTITFLAPRSRQNQVTTPASLDVSGPLRFFAQEDPLIIGQIQAWRNRYPDRFPFQDFQLPQAILELKGRVAMQPGHTHLILDGRILARSYRDEVLGALADLCAVMIVDDPPVVTPPIRAFLTAFEAKLIAAGLKPSLDITDEDADQLLRMFWQTPTFRPLLGTPLTQLDIIRRALKEQDQLVVLPTGGGKSLCFQLPAMLLADEEPARVTLVFSPLIALMADQVNGLQRRGAINAIALNSSLSPVQRQAYLEGIRMGEYSIIYLAPEQIYSAAIRRALQERSIGLVAIDEAHCLSQWGHDFRTDYFGITKWLERALCRGLPRTFPIIALTATARQRNRDDQTSTVDDIISQLRLDLGSPDQHKRAERLVITSTRRPELHFEVEAIPVEISCPNCHQSIPLSQDERVCHYCHATITRMDALKVQEAVEQAKLNRLVALLGDAHPQGLRDRWQHQHQRGLIYCAYTKTTESVAESLRKHLPDLRIAHYHGKLDDLEKAEVLRRFTTDGIADGLDIVVATNAFGMGIDVRRLGFVIHFDTPGTLEAYYQEAGRAGRDPSFNEANPARCILLYHSSDAEKQRYLNRLNTITEREIRDVYTYLQQCAMTTTPDQDGSIALFITPSAVEVHAGLSAEQFAQALYYLEYHATMHAQPILARGESQYHIWQIAWTEEFEMLLHDLPASSLSQQLVTLLRTPGPFQLQVLRPQPIALAEIGTTLRWGNSKVEEELVNLLQRRLIVVVSDASFRWRRTLEESRAILDRIQQDLLTIFQLIQQNATQRSDPQHHDRVYATQTRNVSSDRHKVTQETNRCPLTTGLPACDPSPVRPSRHLGGEATSRRQRGP